MITRAEATEQILAAKQAKGLTFEAIAEAVGRHTGLGDRRADGPGHHVGRGSSRGRPGPRARPRGG